MSASGLGNAAIVVPARFPRLVRPPFFCELEAAVDSGSHVMLMGARGTGKTTAVRLLAQQRGKKLHTISCHADMTTEELRGTQGLSRGDSTFIHSNLVHAARNGDYLLVDEANLARPG